VNTFLAEAIARGDPADSSGRASSETEFHEQATRIGRRGGRARLVQEAGWSGPSMGGRLEIRVAAPAPRLPEADRAAAQVGRRIGAWASRLTRFSSSSDLARLNLETSEPLIAVRPTLASVLEWAQEASRLSGGIVDVTLLDARLTAESPITCAICGAPPRPRSVDGVPSWSVWRRGRRAIMERRAGTRFDLDGVAKGWLADRAAARLRDWPGALVDADGDIALHVTPGVEWLIGVADPRGTGDGLLATFAFGGSDAVRQSFGVATSGTSVHRWAHPGGHVTHHLIDPRTLDAARTDLVQATVVAQTAREAEAFAKAAVILGSAAGLRFLEQSAAVAAILLTDGGETISLPGTGAWLA
jgi:thiamine biosynthesis lipoprotein